MNRTDRLHAITLTLQSQRLVKAFELANEFGISLRTVYRDIRALQNSGVPVEGEAGIGYSLAKSFSLPPVSFSREEALALLLAGKALKNFPDALTQKEYPQALKKIRAALKVEQQDDLEMWERSIEILGRPRNPHAQKTDSIMLLIQNALLQQQIVEIEYYASYNQTTEIRLVNSVGLVYYAKQWHLIGWCHLRKDYRDFRLDRIQSLHLKEDYFIASDFKNLKEYGEYQKSQVKFISCVVQFSKEVSEYTKDSYLGMGIVAEKVINEEWVEVEFLIPELEYFARWLLMYTNSVKVIEPPILRRIMQSLKEEIPEYKEEVC